MNNALQRIQAWRSLRKQSKERRALEWWERKRVEGKTRFVWRTALVYGLSVAGVADIFQRVWFGESDSLLFNAILYVICGIVSGYMTWSEMEAKREDALRKANAKPLPDNQTLHQSDQGVSKA
jgi:uncharacterized membrane protein